MTLLCEYLYEDGIQCGEKVITKPDKTKPSVYYITEPQSDQDFLRFTYDFPLIVVSSFCYYHDKVMSGRLFVVESNHKRHAYKLKVTQERTKKYTVYTKVQEHLR